MVFFCFFSSRRRHTISLCDWSSDVCSSDLRPRTGSGRAIFRRDLLSRSAEPEPESDGFDGYFVVHGQWHADRGVQHETAWEHQARGDGGARGLEGNASVIGNWKSENRKWILAGLVFQVSNSYFH